MPVWSNTAPDEPRGPALPIRRTPAYKSLVAIVTSEDIVGCYTHFHKGHTVPCEPPNCEACSDGIPYRWHAYASAVDYQTGLHFIFECTAQSSEALTSYRDANGSLRGCMFVARRMNQRPNGRIMIQTKPADLTQHRLPNAPDLTKCLAILWSLPMDAVAADRRNPEKNMPQLATDPEQTDPKKLLEP